MTEIVINANDRRIQYTATAGQTVFPYDFPIYEEADITVLRNRAGTLSTLVLTTDYTLSGVGAEAGGNATLTSGATLNDVMTIYGATPYERTSDYGTGGDFKASTLNKDLDRLVMMSQQLDTRLNRTLTLNIADPATGMELAIETAANRLDRALVFNSAGTGLEAGPTITEISNAQTYATNAATSATNAAASETAAAASETAAAASEVAAATSETNAATSETNAATSETNAAASETAAAASETNAATSASAASTSATNAATSETNASNSASSASTSATNASNSASAAATSETNAATSESNAADSATASEDWAIRAEDDPVPIASGGDGSTTFSAYHWAQKAQDFATGAAVNISVDDVAFTELTGTNVQTVLDDIDDYLAGLGLLADNDTVGETDIDDAAVTLAKMANLAQSTIIGRAAGAGTGVPTALSESQVKTVLGLPTTTTDNGVARFDGTTGNMQNSSGVTVSDTHVLSASGGLQSKGVNLPDMKYCTFNGNGTVTILESIGASSVTDNNTGNYTVNWSGNFSSIYYAVALAANRNVGTSNYGNATLNGALTVSSVPVYTAYVNQTSGVPTLYDATFVSVQAMGVLA